MKTAWLNLHRNDLLKDEIAYRHKHCGACDGKPSRARRHKRLHEIGVNEIEDEAYDLGKMSREVSTSDMGEIVLKRLNKVDKVAYIRFASVYKHFNDLDEFITEVKKVGGTEK